MRSVRCARCGRQSREGTWVGPVWYGTECVKYALSGVTESDEEYFERKSGEQR